MKLITKLTLILLLFTSCTQHLNRKERSSFNDASYIYVTNGNNGKIGLYQSSTSIILKSIAYPLLILFCLIDPIACFIMPINESKEKVTFTKKLNTIENRNFPFATPILISKFENKTILEKFFFLNLTDKNIKSNNHINLNIYTYPKLIYSDVDLNLLSFTLETKVTLTNSKNKVIWKHYCEKSNFIKYNIDLFIENENKLLLEQYKMASEFCYSDITKSLKNALVDS